MSRLATVKRDYFRNKVQTGPDLCFGRRDIFLSTARYWRNRQMHAEVVNYVNLARVWHLRGLQAKAQRHFVGDRE